MRTAIPSTIRAASVGLSVEPAGELTAARKRRWGRLGHALAALRALGRLRPFSAELKHADGRVERLRTVQVAVGTAAVA